MIRIKIHHVQSAEYSFLSTLLEDTIKLIALFIYSKQPYRDVTNPVTLIHKEVNQVVERKKKSTIEVNCLCPL